MKGRIKRFIYGRKYLQCDDGIVDYPRKRDVIKKI